MRKDIIITAVCLILITFLASSAMACGGTMMSGGRNQPQVMNQEHMGNQGQGSSYGMHQGMSYGMEQGMTQGLQPETNPNVQEDKNSNVNKELKQKTDQES
jgi:hypothetical protein